MVAVAAVDYIKLRDYARLLYVLSVLSLGAVLALGNEHKGIKAWFDIGPFQIQPAEVAKVLVIVAVASYLGTSIEKLGAKHLAVALLMFGVPMGLIMLQPDLGTEPRLRDDRRRACSPSPASRCVSWSPWPWWASSGSSASCRATRSTSTSATV